MIIYKRTADGELVELSVDEIAAIQQAPIDPGLIQSEIIARTQQRLDAFSQTRGYDGILSLCTYATSHIPRFSIEGQYGVQVRDATWAKLYDILADVQNGVRPIPTGYSDIEAELPVLTWPA